MHNRLGPRPGGSRDTARSFGSSLASLPRRIFGRPADSDESDLSLGPPRRKSVIILESLRPFWVTFRSAALEREFSDSKFGGNLAALRMICFLTLTFGLVSLQLFSSYWINRTLVPGWLGVLGVILIASLVPALHERVFRRHGRVVTAVVATGLALWALAYTGETQYHNPKRVSAGEGLAQSELYAVVVMAVVPAFPFIHQAEVVALLSIICLTTHLMVRFSDMSYTDGELTNDLMVLVLLAIFFVFISRGRQHSRRWTFLLIRRLRSENIEVKLSVGGENDSVTGTGTAVARWLAGRARRVHNDVTTLDNELSNAPWAVDSSTITFGKSLGQGAFGEVFLATWRSNTVAVKSIPHELIRSAEKLNYLTSEVSLLFELRHPNIVLFMGISIDHEHVNLITEFMERGSLSRIIHSQEVLLSRPIQAALLTQAARGMRYLHSLEPAVLHRDLKSANVLVDSKWNAKIADFGMSIISGKGILKDAGNETEHYSLRLDANPAGTPIYMAPEVIHGLPHMPVSDVYSFGIIIWELFARKIPYAELIEDTSNDAVMVQVANQAIRPDLGEIMTDVPAFAALARQCWSQIPDERPTFEAITTELETLESTVMAETGGGSTGLLSTSIALHPVLPPKGMVAYLHCEVDGASSLWQRHPETTREAIDVVIGIVKELTQKDNGYAASFDHRVMLFVFDDVLRAVRCATEMHLRLVDADWSDAVLMLPTCAVTRGFDNVVVFRGLRLRIAIHTAKALTTEDKFTGQTKYYGKAVEVTGQMCQAAFGGETVLSNAVRRKVESELVQRPDRFTFSPLGQSRWEDLADVAPLYQVLPRLLESRPDSWHNKVPQPMPFDWIIEADELTIGRKLGQGAYGCVFEGAFHGRQVAVKRLLAQVLSDQTRTKFVEQVCVMRKLVHPNIVEMFGTCLEPNNVSLVLEYLPYNLRQVLDDAGSVLSSHHRLNMLRNIAAGMEFMHSCGIMHRDLKSPNLLVDRAGFVKICDFEMARVKLETATMTRCGTVAWCAPEVLLGRKYEFKADVFSFAIVMWEVLTRDLPWKGGRAADVAARIVAGERPPIRDNHQPDIDFEALMMQCWLEDPVSRPTFPQICQRMAQLDNVLASGSEADPIGVGSNVEPAVGAAQQAGEPSAQGGGAAPEAEQQVAEPSAQEEGATPEAEQQAAEPSAQKEGATPEAEQQAAEPSAQGS